MVLYDLVFPLQAFDSADEAHYNESALGAAIRESGIARSEFYVTTKLHPQHHGRASAAAAVRRSASALGVDYIDLVLIHATECDGDEQCSARRVRAPPSLTE